MQFSPVILSNFTPVLTIARFAHLCLIRSHVNLGIRRLHLASLTDMRFLPRPTRVPVPALFIALACSDATRVCTLLGCQSGVTVHLPALPSQPFRIEVRTSPSDVAYIFDCTDDNHRCRQDIFFPGLIADRLFVTVRVGTASRETEVVQVTYAHSHPNGPNCPPDCQTADVSAALPS